MTRKEKGKGCGKGKRKGGKFEFKIHYDMEPPELKDMIKKKAKKEGLSKKWIDYILNMIFLNFSCGGVSVECKNCSKFKSDQCKGGDFPDCFIEEAKSAKKEGVKPPKLPISWEK